MMWDSVINWLFSNSSKHVFIVGPPPKRGGSWVFEIPQKGDSELSHKKGGVVNIGWLIRVTLLTLTDPF